MKIEFYGASEGVTGSCHILKFAGKNILLDCGMYQGKDVEQGGNDTFPFDPKDINLVLISHAHIDHTGRLPLLYKRGFRGKVYGTKATVDLMKIMLLDSGHIQEMDVKWKNRKRERRGESLLKPLYSFEEAKEAEVLYEAIDYDTLLSPFPNFSFRFRDAGHLLGSAIIEIITEEKNGTEKLVYSGDLGNRDIPIIKDPTNIDACDYLIMESTYGDRIHQNNKDEIQKLINVIYNTIQKGGNVIIPSFAVGRVQEVLYLLNDFIEGGKLKGINIYVDSPLASECTKIFQKYKDYYDTAALDKLAHGDDPLNFTNLHFVGSAEESAKLNEKNGIVIISSSGMCEAGRILHHLKHNLWRKDSSVVFVGYQAEGTLGRKIIEGEKRVRLFGEYIIVNAQIYNFPGLSGHADSKGLLDWVVNFKEKPANIILVHGSKTSSESLRLSLHKKGYNVHVAKKGEKIFYGENYTRTGMKDTLIHTINSLEDIDNLTTDEILDQIKKAIDKIN